MKRERDCYASNGTWNRKVQSSSANQQGQRCPTADVTSICKAATVNAARCDKLPQAMHKRAALCDFDRFAARYGLNDCIERGDRRRHFGRRDWIRSSAFDSQCECVEFGADRIDRRVRFTLE